VWADLTSQYLRIKPHPELSWWAMRGQLIDAPGYLMNYAIGAMITTDLRRRMVQERGSFATADSTWYPWISERIYRFGLERLSRDVLEGFLGRPISPRALLDDMGRMGKDK
jgi:Zn-dependent M32 family carboxypeptidase